MKSSKQSPEALEELYRDRYDSVLNQIAETLRLYIADVFRSQPRIDRITARAKGVKSFLNKADTRVGPKDKLKYSEPLAQIQDQIGARIIVFYRSDVERLDAIVKQYFTAIEYRDRVPDSEWEFGYFGRHYVLILPSDVIDDTMDRSKVPDFFELQIKTLFQHAWSEADHDLGYKEEAGRAPLTSEEKRKLAYTSAQAWGADHMFDELFRARPEGN